jgi:transcriptional regulator with XRE-family HTH domain
MLKYNLKKLRKMKNVTREDIAEALDLSVHTVAKYEQGKIQPTLETIEKLTKFFKVSYDALLGSKSDYELINECSKNNNLERLLSNPYIKNTVETMKPLTPQNRASLNLYAKYLLAMQNNELKQLTKEFK